MRLRAGQLQGLEKLLPGEKQQVSEREREQEFLDNLWQAWMRTAVQIVRAGSETKPWSIGVTSAVRGEGRTSSSVGLAAAIARETVNPVVLVDADLRNPKMATIFGLSGGYGLDDYLANRCTLEGALARTRVPNLAVLPAGVPNGRQQTSVDAPFVFRRRLPSLLAELRESFAYTVFDLPPLLQDSNTAGIAGELDGIVLVTREGFTELHQLEEGNERLAGANVICTATIMPPQTVPGWAQRLMHE